MNDALSPISTLKSGFRTQPFGLPFNILTSRWTLFDDLWLHYLLSANSKHASEIRSSLIRNIYKVWFVSSSDHAFFFSFYFFVFFSSNENEHEFAEWCKLKDELPLGRVGYAMYYRVVIIFVEAVHYIDIGRINIFA